MARSLTSGEIRRQTEEFVSLYATRHAGRNWWRRPLLATAVVDERFDILGTVAATDHLLPRDLLPSARSVIVYFLPFVRELAAENKPGNVPCRNWGVAYNQTNELISHINEHLRGLFSDYGYETAVTPPTANFDPVHLLSQWSHKHLAHIAGLGRFGINAQIITPAGCTGRLGSLVTSADLGDSPLTDEPEHCLHKRGIPCLECAARCPIHALSEEGCHRKRCYARIKTVQKHENLSDLPDHTEVCGKCAVMLPCSFNIPSVN